MKKIICTLLAFIMLITASVQVSALSELENLGTPFEKYLINCNEEIVGRSIWDMTVYKDRLYIGWGDYGRNLGSKLGGIPNVNYFLATDTWKHDALLDDEQISRFFHYDDKLYITGTDPIKEVGNLYIGNKEGNWSTVSTFDGGIHVFDMLVSDGVIYLSYGQSTNSKAVIRYSTDTKTFKDIEFRYDGEPIIPTGEAFARCYNLFSFDGEIYATLSIVDNSTDKFDGIYKLDKTNMVLNFAGKSLRQHISNGLAPSFDCEFQGKYVYAYGSLYYTDDPENKNNWKNMSEIQGKVTCAKVVNESLYITAYTENSGTYTNRLYKTDNLQSAELIYSFDYEAYVQSFCHAKGNFYFGTGCNRDKVSLAAGTVFLLSDEKFEKTDIGIKAIVDTDKKDANTIWITYKLKAGDIVVSEGILNQLNGWEFALKGVREQDDWNVEITETSDGKEWDIESNGRTFLIKKPTAINYQLIIPLSAVGLIALLVFVLVIVIKATKRRKHKEKKKC